VNAGADVNAVAGDGKTPLALASSRAPTPCPNALVNTPRARMREGSPRIVFATALMCAAFAADLELVNLLLERGADPSVISKDGETMVTAAAGPAFIHYGITPLIAAGNYGDVPIIQYLIDVGADLGARPGEEERRPVRVEQRTADADRLRDRGRHLRGEQRRDHS
jgi:hypothetical protein